jgi:predicted ATPase
VILQLRIDGYRSLRSFELDIGQLTVITGANGCGKSNCYRAIALLARAAAGRLAWSIVQEGGMPSVLWAGKKRRSESADVPKRMVLGVRTDEFSYELQAGLPPKVPPQTCFDFDPEVKQELIWHGDKPRPSTTLLKRQAGSAWLHDMNGDTVTYPAVLLGSESVLAQLQEPHLYPEASALRQTLLGWRFYHTFSTETRAAQRRQQVGVRTPVLSDDGSDLAAALQTIIEIGDEQGLYESVTDAFADSRLIVEAGGGLFAFGLRKDGINRPFMAAELSDGTLRYLCLIAALLSPRPPAFLALNEPETSLHPDLLPALARLIHRASQASQIMVVTHAKALVEALGALSGEPPVNLYMHDGETRIEGQDHLYLGH